MALNHALARAGAMALVLLSASGAHADGYLVRNAPGTVINLRGHTLGTNDVLPYLGLTDLSGNPITATNPLPMGPGISTVTPIDRGGVIATAGAAQQMMAANVSRKAGWIIGDPGNQGTLYVSLTGSASTTPGAGKQCVIGPTGGSCPLTVNGYVISTAVSIAGTVQGDAFEAVEFQ